MGISSQDADGVRENNLHNELLAWTTGQIDRLVHGEAARQQVLELVDWLARFTREHFGFQQRLLAECSSQAEYLSRRMGVHLEFRRELAQLCLDAIRGDASVSGRLSELCHRILQDAQAEQVALAELIRAHGHTTRVRADHRRRPLRDEATRLIDSRAIH